jgi:hypothetical protein
MAASATAFAPVEQLAEALFVSPLQPSDRPSAAQVRDAIVASLRAFGGVDGCAVQCAEEFGEHPEVAVMRMRWALSIAAA